MTTTATVRGAGNLDDTTATHIATLWNAAYPTMRQMLTAWIDRDRTLIRNEAWQIGQNRAAADDALAFYAPSEKTTRNRLKQAEDLRLTLGQLDRGSYRGCTRSPGAFSPSGAYQSVRSLLAMTSLNDRDLDGVYELAAALSRITDEQHRAWLKAHGSSGTAD